MAEAPKLRLYNTLTRAKEDFVPLDPKNVRMYVCGPTVYDFAHIGNARPVIVFDVLFRLLRHLYGPEHVTYVRNITDIDDKINKRAFERWTRKRSLLDEVRELTDVTAQQYSDDVTALGNLPPTHAPRATDFVCDGAKPMDMVRVIEKLVARGVAYEAEGHVLFSPKAMDELAAKGGVPAYGRLSRRPLDEMIAGARVDVAPYKRDPMDFVLWKPSDRETEPGWESPWGFGRPGWHIECSAMAGALLGEQFDIHAGGIDLVFPHHENEIAQSCCAFGIDKMA
ncbi:MAG: cysteine--tRNA ligase, partial [Beijerinckiaceae bacterium]